MILRIVRSRVAWRKPLEIGLSRGEVKQKSGLCFG